MQRFPSLRYESLKSPEVHWISILGTIHTTRWRWNPFDPENRMCWSHVQQRWQWRCLLKSDGGRHGDGVYSCRMIVNHNMRRVIKTEGNQEEAIWSVAETSLGEGSDNINFSVSTTGEYLLCLNGERTRFWIEAEDGNKARPYPSGTNYQLNGFPWDDADMFEKFDETQEDRNLQQLTKGTWEILVPLKADGGIDFRSDGVYQFLISADRNEDMGLSALNHTVSSDGSSIQLVRGSGFGSSHGTSEHSAPTIRVSDDGLYRFSLNTDAGEARLSVSSEGRGSASFLNAWTSMHLLGSVHDQDPFDPSQEATCMVRDGRSGAHTLEVDVAAGPAVINFALGGELFLDTMGLGCWLDEDSDGAIRGIGWHGKPNESNICFHVLKEGRLRIQYFPSDDLFSISHLDGNQYLERVEGIYHLSLVGNFEAPLVAWDPQAEENLMRPLGPTSFERCLMLEQGKEYEYKYVANRSSWQLVFADYELDGFGMAYGEELNPSPLDTSLERLRHYGHLTTHGNPPALKFTPRTGGLHRFVVDLRTGAYGVTPLACDSRGG